MSRQTELLLVLCLFKVHQIPFRSSLSLVVGHRQKELFWIQKAPFAPQVFSELKIFGSIVATVEASFRQEMLMTQEAWERNCCSIPASLTHIGKS